MLSVPKYVMCVSSLGEYRRKSISHLVELLGEELTIYASPVAIDPTVRTIVPPELGVKGAPVVKLGPLAFQRVSPVAMIRAEVLLLDLNPRMPQVWLYAAVRKMLGRPTALWGHAWPRAGRASRTARVRLALARLSDLLVAYTHTQAEELRSAVPGVPVVAAPNAIDLQDDFGFDTGRDRTSFLYVGRLVREKGVDVALRAFLNSNLPEESKLYIVGEGPARVELEKIASESGQADRVRFLGHVSSRDDLRLHYSEAVMTLSPGYVGLSLIQSLSFGVPMLIASGLMHSPEVEAANEANSVFCDTRDLSTFSAALEQAFEGRHKWAARGPEIASSAARLYSAEAMAAGLASAFRRSR